MKSILDTNVTLFKNYATSTGGVQVNLLKYLKSDKYYLRQLEIALLKSSDPEAYKKRKSELICILPSCTDCSARGNNASFKHTGLLQVDIDLDKNIHVTDWNELKHSIAKIPQVAYAGLSISGQGLWTIIPIFYPEKHLEHFLFIEEYFKKFGLTIDASCKNVQRLRGYAFDPEAYFNHNAQTLSNFFKPNSAPSRPLNQLHGTNDMHKQVKSLIDQINTRNVDIAPDYDTYLELAFSFATEFGSSGEGYFLDICSHHQAYDEKKAINKYKNALATNSGRVTIGTFFHLCKTAGISLQSNYNRKNSLKTTLMPFSTLMNDAFEDVKFSNEEKMFESTDVKQTDNQNKTVHPQEKKLEKIDTEDLSKLKIKVTQTIKDPSYLKWLIKNIDRIIQTGIPRNRYDPDIKELFEAGDFQKTN